MARQLAWAFAILLLSPGAGRAADVCEKDRNAQPQRQEPQRGQDTKGDKDRKDDQSRRRVKWWIDPKERAELDITDDQSAKLEAVWRKDLRQRFETRQALDKLEETLSKMLADPAVDETAVIAHIDRVEATRAQVNKDRVLLLFRMNRLLTPGQRQKVDAKAKAMREQRDGDRRGGSSSR